MKRFRIWLLRKMIALCDYSLSAHDDEPQHELNWMVAQRNYFQRELRELEG